MAEIDKIGDGTVTITRIYASQAGDIGIAPTFTTAPGMPATVTSGDDITVSLGAADGLPDPTVTITAATLDGEDVLADFAGTTYSTPSGLAEDAALAVTVEASNGVPPAAVVTLSSTVEPVEVAPAFTTQPSMPSTIAPGATITVNTGEASGQPMPEISITAVTLGGTDVLADFDGQGYTAPRGLSQDATLAVTVTAANGISPAATATLTATLQADTQAPSFDVAPSLSTTSPAPGQPVTVRDTAASGSPPPTVTITASVGGASVSVSGGQFTVPSGASDGDAIAVEVVAANGVPSAATAELTGSVQVAPASVTGSLADRTITAGESVSIDVAGAFSGADITYALAPSSQALPDGLSLSSDGIITGTPDTIDGTSIALDIAIEASNSGGAAQQGFTLVVEAAPVTTITQESAPSLTALDAGETYLSAYTGGTSGTYSADNGASIDTVAHQMRADGANVADGATASAGASVTVVETVTASDGATASFTSPAVTVGSVSGFAPAWADFANGYLYNSSLGNEPASATEFTFAVTYRPSAADIGSRAQLFGSVGSTGVLGVEKAATDTLDVSIADDTGAQVYSLGFGTSLSAGTDYLILISASAADGANAVVIDLSDGSLLESETAASTNPTFDTTPLDWVIGAASDRGVRTIDGAIERAMLWLGTYADVSQAAVQGHFHDAGALKDPSVAATNIGTPHIQVSGSGLTTGANAGSGDDFTVSGTITAVSAASTPMKVSSVPDQELVVHQAASIDLSGVWDDPDAEIEMLPASDQLPDYAAESPGTLRLDSANRTIAGTPGETVSNVRIVLAAKNAQGYSEDALRFTLDVVQSPGWRPAQGWAPDRDEGTDADYYVATDGDDTAAGSEAAPFATLSRAVEQSRTDAAARTIAVRGGTYRSYTYIDGIDNPLVVKGYGTEKPTFTAAEPLSGLTACTSADSGVLGDTWPYVRKMTFDMSTTEHGAPEKLNLYEDGWWIPLVALRADMRFLFFDDDESFYDCDYALDASGNITGIISEEVFGQYSENQIVGAPVTLRHDDNRIDDTYITAYDPATYTATIANQGLGDDVNGKRRFTVFNFPGVMFPGSWSYVEGSGTEVTLYVWPLNRTSSFEYSARFDVIKLDTWSATIGFRSIAATRAVWDLDTGGRFSGICLGTDQSTSKTRKGLELENCFFGETRHSHNGITHIYGVDRVRRTGNTYARCDTYGHANYDCTDMRAQFEHHYYNGSAVCRTFGVQDNYEMYPLDERSALATHGNHRNFYRGSDTTLVFGCRSYDIGGYYTFQDASNTAIFMSDLGRLEDGRIIADQQHAINSGHGGADGSGAPVADTDQLTVCIQTRPAPIAGTINETLLGNPTTGEITHMVACTPNGGGYDIWSDDLASYKYVRGGNVFTKTIYWQKSAYGWSEDATSVYTDEASVFEDYLAGDYRHVSGSPVRGKTHDASAEWALLEGRFPWAAPHGGEAALRRDINGDTIDPANAPVGPRLDPDRFDGPARRVPFAMAAPTVTASGGVVTAIRPVEPDNGGEMIRRYDLRWRVDGGSWSERSDVGESEEITASGTVEVEFRAVNRLGAGAWGDIGSSA